MYIIGAIVIISFYFLWELKHTGHQSSRHRSLTRERRQRATAAHNVDRARTRQDSLLSDPSKSSSHSSNDLCLDLYVDAEQEELMSASERSLNVNRNNIEALQDVNGRLSQKLKEANERTICFSTFPPVRDMSVPSLIQTITNLANDRLNLAIEVPTILREWNADRDAITAELRRTQAELDRRSSDWKLKHERYEAQDYRLRERARQLGEQNVTLQREVSSLSEREDDAKNTITSLEQDLYKFQEKYKDEKELRESIQLNNEEKVKECMDLHRSVSRLHRTCREQEKSIDGLSGLCEELGKNMPIDDVDSHLRKLQMEQIRLTDVEQSLRKEVDTYRQELDSLGHENINLLERLKGISGGPSSLKLELELSKRVSILQNQGLSLLVDSVKLSGKLLNEVKRKSCENVKDGPYIEDSGLHNFVIESEVELQGYKRGTEKLSMLLQSLRIMLQEKSSQSQLRESDNDIPQQNDHKLSVIDNPSLLVNIQAELRAETLLTTLLKKRLYYKELETEQLEAELATVVRGHDVLKCETEYAMDSLRCATQKMQDLQLEMITKDEDMNQLQNKLQDCNKELAMVRGILQRVTEEREQQFKEVRKYSEENMLLNYEINAMKKKIETLEEDILIKEGQISIIQDSIPKPFNYF